MWRRAVGLRTRFQIWLSLLVLGITFSCTKTAEPTLRVLTFRDRQSAALRESLHDFEKAYSVNVQMDDIPAESMATKMMTDLAGGGTYDVYAMDEPFVPQFSSSLLPVSEWPVGSVSFEEDQFEKPSLEAASVDGVLMGLPVNGNVYQYIYRKDLFESPEEKENYLKQFSKPLAPAKTFSEMMDLARFFHRPPKLYGFAPFTKMSEGTTVELLWLFSGFGITPAAGPIPGDTIRNALTFYESLLGTAPKSAKSWHHTERMTAYAKGKIAQMMTWNSFFFDLEDEDKSLVAGKTGYAPSPGDSKTGIAGSWIAGVRRGSPEAQRAADFVRWWTSKSLGEKLIPRGLATPRKDLLTDGALSQNYPWLQATHLNFEKAFLRPRHKDYRSVSSELSKVFTRWIAKQEDTSAAADQLLTAYTRLQNLVMKTPSKKLEGEAHNPEPSAKIVSGQMVKTVSETTSKSTPDSKPDSKSDSNSDPTLDNSKHLKRTKDPNSEKKAK